MMLIENSFALSTRLLKKDLYKVREKELVEGYFNGRPTVVDYYIEYENENAYLVVSNNKDRRLSKDGLNHFVKKLVRLSGVKFHLHMFRHTFACGLAKNGIGSYNLQKLMGHTDLRITDRYLRSMGVEDLRDDVNNFSIDNLI